MAAAFDRRRGERDLREASGVEHLVAFHRAINISDFGFAHAKLVERMGFIGGGAMQDFILMHARRVGAIGEADRFFGGDELLELVGDEDVERVRAAQVVAFELVVVVINI